MTDEQFEGFETIEGLTQGDFREQPFNPDNDNLVKHARRELEIAGIPQEDRDLLLPMVEKFASYGHSGGSASWFIAALVRLLQFENLADLTTNPDEWTQVSEEDGGVWQCSRNPEAFSQDGGKTYYLLSEVPGGNPRKRHEVMRTSRDHTKPMG